MLSFFLVFQVSGISLYEEIQAGKRRLFRVWEEETTQGMRVYALSEEETHVFWLDTHYATEKWFFTNAHQRFVIERSGNFLVRKEEGIVVSNYTIDEAPWYQFVEVSFRPWLVSGKKVSPMFWIFQPGVMVLHKMIAYRENEEPLVLQGKSLSSLKVRMTLPGAKAAFWRAWYWFDTNGVFLRYEGVRIVGQPVTKVERKSP
ncbi:MAG: hypothetical protein N2314_04890 [Brevinematales bacterium]|nr:hypothetical protein [Brevinematales bacterium]